MPTIFSASESTVLVNGEPVHGVQSIQYRRTLSRENVYALGSSERIGVIRGRYAVEGRLTVLSTSQQLDALREDDLFLLSATFRQGETEVNVSFEDCQLVDKQFELGVGGHGMSEYAFIGVRMREE